MNWRPRSSRTVQSRFSAIILLSASPACLESDDTYDDGQIWSAFYESCIDACPPNQAYDDRGICNVAASVVPPPS